MESITLKEIEGYSHTDLKFTCPKGYNFGGIITDLEELTLKCAYEGWIMFKEVPGFYPIGDFKPLLHNFSMLTQEIEHNGEKIIPMNIVFPCDQFDDLIGATSMSYANDFLKSENPLKLCNELSFWEKLYELHFDLHGLIGRGVAIDKSKI